MTAGREPVSRTKDWCTPPEYVTAAREALGGRIHFDPCSNKHSVVGADVELMPPVADGLKSDWNYPTIYVNPPYGRCARPAGAAAKTRSTIKDWLRKCSEARAAYDSEIVALVPVATNTSHWQQYVFTATAICFLKVPRLKFMLDGEAVGKGAPMSCAVIYWGGDLGRFRHAFAKFGAVLATGV